jgi:hypothetical protein
LTSLESNMKQASRIKALTKEEKNTKSKRRKKSE